MRECSVDGCSSQRYCRDLCVAHYKRVRRTGTTNARVARASDAEALFEIQTDDCVVWPYGKSHGYGSLHVDGRSVGLHVLATEKLNGPRPRKGMHAAHSCGNRSCINPRHLRWATPTENAADRVVHGTETRGLRNGKTKLTEEQVQGIRDARSAGETCQKIADRYGVAHATVSKITRGLARSNP